MDESQVAEYFDSNSEIYREIEQRGSAAAPWKRKAIKEYLEDSYEDSLRVLDIGCGSGTFVNYTNAIEGFDQNIGVDISRGMLPDRENNDQADFMQASASNLPFQENSFDLIHISKVLHHIVGDTRHGSKQQSTSVLDDIMNILKPNGMLIITEKYYEGPLSSMNLTSKIIFYGLKFLGDKSTKMDSDAHGGLLVSFYTKSELHEMVYEAGGLVESIETHRTTHKKFVRV